MIQDRQRKPRKNGNKTNTPRRTAGRFFRVKRLVVALPICHPVIEPINLLGA
ncbi:hypothetical protein CLV75_0316 [Ruegeria conchae]|uniref:Uncharacterized protein n=1 Tax=Ruegeria conchae TaxID=981384 RepID=A0A497ZQV3_9RHOB|nr:hypothetical protein CLV75_0316 [Ruegeria conchae]